VRARAALAAAVLAFGALLAATVLAFGALLAAAPAASAHDKLESTSPKAGSTVTTPPAAITLTFNAPAFKIGSRIRVLGPAGDVAAGEPAFKDRTVRQALQPGSPAGEYTVEWQVTSADGHPIAGRWTFTAREAGTTTPEATTPEPTTAPTEEATPSPAATVSTASTGAETGGSPSTGMIVGVTVVVAVVLLAAAAGVALTRRRGG
jgi:methionine-rich copper-binding protein CopC